MATIGKGLTDGHGTFGNIIIYKWRGMDLIRSMPKKSHHIPTEAQLINRQKFTTVSKFLAPLRMIICRYFGVEGNGRSKLNKASSYHLCEAVIGMFPDYSLDYKKVVICMGELADVLALQAVVTEENSLHFLWNDNTAQALANVDDHLTIVIYNETVKQFEIYNTMARRDDLACIAILPSDWTTAVLHCWAYFVSNDGALNSTNNYFKV